MLVSWVADDSGTPGDDKVIIEFGTGSSLFSAGLTATGLGALGRDVGLDAGVPVPLGAVRAI